MSETYIEYLRFIRETGAEIRELNEKLRKKDKEIKELVIRCKDLEKQVQKKENEIENISDINQHWYEQYEQVYRDKCDMEQKLDIMTSAIEIIAPNLKEKIDEDISQGFFSDLLNNTRNKFRW